MNRPRDVRRLHVGDMSYKIVHINDDKISETEEGSMQVGNCNEHKATMIIAVRSHDADETFLHETLHAINYNRALGFDEKQIVSLSHGLYQVLRDNKLYFGNDAAKKKVSADK